MPVAVGMLLVLLSWAALIVVIVSSGLLPSIVMSGVRHRQSRPLLLRHSLWWGLLLAVLGVMFLNLLMPLSGGLGAGIIMAGVGLIGIPGWLVFARQVRKKPSVVFRLSDAALWVALMASVAYLSVAALGPVTNYDSGLYHLGAIAYASQFPTVPGIANLFFALGYSSAEFPMAAVLGNGPWQENGFRLLNGLIMLMALADLWWRSRERSKGAGFFVLAAGILSAWVPLVALSDYWVTSPTQDASSFVLAIVLSAYLAQAVAGGPHWRQEAATALAIAVLLVLIRPTMIVFVGSAFLVVAILALRRRGGRGSTPAPAIPVVVAVVVSGVALALRDRVLSGWLQYPLSIYAFDVPWRAADPIMDRVGTLGYHRNPEDLWASVDGWQWVVPWLEDRLIQWETYQFLGLMVVALVVAGIAHRLIGPRLRPRGLFLTLVPSIAGTIFWFSFTPPSFRFVWGVIFSLGTIPIGWVLWRLSRWRSKTWDTVASIGVGLPILAVVLFSASFRLELSQISRDQIWSLGPISITYSIAALPEPIVGEFLTNSGLVLKQPFASEQCWGLNPLCTPRPNLNLKLRGEDVSSGFVID